MNGYHKTTDEPYQEIWKLQEMLEKAKIPYEFQPLFDGWHILYPDSVKTECSVTGILLTIIPKMRFESPRRKRRSGR